MGSSPVGAPNTVGEVKICNFRPMSSYISETVQDGHSYCSRLIGIRMQSIIWYYFQWLSLIPSYPKPPHVLIFPFPVFIMGGDRRFIFHIKVDHSKSQPTDDKPLLKGAWSWSHDPFLGRIIALVRCGPLYCGLSVCWSVYLSWLWALQKLLNLVSENVSFVGLGYNADKILGGKICNKDFWRIHNSFQVIKEKCIAL